MAAILSRPQYVDGHVPALVVSLVEAIFVQVKLTYWDRVTHIYMRQ